MTHSNQTISPLRQRMIDDMVLRKLKPRTQEAHIRAVKRLPSFLKRPPDTATADDLRRFQLGMATNGASSHTINVTVTGLRFFFETTMENHEVMRKMSTIREPRRLPTILSADEVKRLLDATTSLKYRAALSTAYGAGLLQRPCVSSPVIQNTWVLASALPWYCIPGDRP